MDWVWVLFLVVVVGGTGVAWWAHRPSPPARPAPPPAHPRTVTIKRPGGVTETRDVEDDGRSFDQWVADMGAKSQQAKRDSRPRVTEVRIDEDLERVDLRELPSSRFRIVGSEHWVRESDRAVFGGTEYALVREADNEHDESAVALYGRGRKVGYLSRAKAAGLAPELDRLGPAAFLVRGAGPSETSIRMWVDLPLLPGVRALTRAAGDSVGGTE